MKKRTRKRLGDLLLEAGLITEEQLQSALRDRKPNQKIGEALLQKGYITEQQLIEVLEFQLGVPHVSLYGYPFEKNLLNLVSKETAKRHLLIPLKKQGDKLYIAMADPLDFIAIEHLRLSTGFQIEPVIASKDEILRAISRYYDVEDGFEEFAEEPVRPTETEDVTEQDSPVVRLVNQLISNAITLRASDIHIDPHETKVVVRYRIDGVLRIEKVLPKSMQSVITARIKIMSNLDITEHRIPQDGRIKINVDVRHVDIRVSTLPTIYGEKIVLRILDFSATISDLNRLGFNKVNLERYLKLIERPNGIVLITGPTGSGKSSTLYATLNRLNSEEVNIITIDDPVEYQLEGINQIQVNPNVGMTFAAGLRAILRQDPNIIMVGEIRDRETAEIAIRASITGHLVFSTLHTNDSLGAVTRLIDMGVEPFLVAASVSGVVAQRLVRRVCRDCAEEHEPTKVERAIFRKRGLTIDRIVRGRGCSSCHMTGYRGRMAIQEVLIIDDEMRHVITNKESFSKLQELAIKNETIFLLDDGLLKIKKGLTTPEEVLKVALPE